MPNYSFKAKDSNQKPVADTIVAGSVEEAKSLLSSQGYQVKSIKKADPKKGWKIPFLNKGISTLERATMCKYLATMIDAGLPLPEAVEVYAQDSQSNAVKQILFEVQQKLQQGQPLSDALVKYPDSFDRTSVSIIKAGEVSGTLTKSLEYLSKQLYSEYKLKQKVKGAMMYPIIIVSAMGGVAGILVFFVLPKIAPIFLQMSVSMPAYSRMILQGGLFVSKNYVLVLTTLVLLFLFVGIGLTKKTGRGLALKIFSLLPAIRLLLDQLDLARFSRTLSTLLSSSVPISEALFIVVSSLSQPKFNKYAEDFQQEVQKGVSLSEILRKRKKLFPAMVIRMVATGEKTGSIDSMFNELADHYEQEIESTLSNFTSILEPVLLLLVGIGVAFMVLSVIAPIYSLVGGIESSTPGR